MNFFALEKHFVELFLDNGLVLSSTSTFHSCIFSLGCFEALVPGHDSFSLCDPYLFIPGVVHATDWAFKLLTFLGAYFETSVDIAVSEAMMPLIS